MRPIKFGLLGFVLLVVTLNNAVFGSIPPLQIDPISPWGEIDSEVVGEVDLQFILPTDVVPTNYKLSIRPILRDDPAGNPLNSAPGTVVISISCVEPTSSITLHSKNINVLQSGVKLLKSGEVNPLIIASQTYDPTQDFYIITLEAALERSANYELTIPFISQVSTTELNGIYLSYYDDPATNERRTLSTTQFQTSAARKAFPCFDEPQYKATFEISVGRHKDFHSLSNNALASSAPDPVLTDWEWDHYKITPMKMSTYLVAFIVSDFTYKEAASALDGKPIRAYGPKYLMDQKGGDFAAEASYRIIKYYQDWVSVVNYSLPKLDSVAIPQFSAGAMENWGLNTYRTEYLLHIPGENTEAERKKISQVLSHEITHQWFGNLVTCKSWKYTWLNEGFARFLQYRGMNAGTPEFNTLVAIISDATQLGMEFDHGADTRPMVKEVTTPDEASDIFSRITYEKAASVIRMIENILKTEVFDNALRDYLLNKLEDSAEQNDLFDSFQKLGENKLPEGVRIHDILETWTFQSGYPVVRVSSAGGNKIYLEQEKFRLNRGTKSMVEEPDYWYIPVKVISASDPSVDVKTPDVWIPNDRSLISFSHDKINPTSWFMVNPEIAGYYRVLYDIGLRNKIRDQLNTDHNVISPGARSQLLDDYFNFAFNGYAPIEAAFDLTNFLDKEKELVVWSPVVTHIRTIFNKLTTVGEETVFKAFQEYFALKIEGALGLIGWEQKPEDVGVDVILRANLLDFACSFNQTQCVEYSQRVFTAWAENPADRTKILPDIRPVVFCAAVANGDQSTWDKVYELYRNEQFPATKTQLYRSLACSKNIGTLYAFLQKALDKESNFDFETVAKYVAANSLGRDITYFMLKANFGPGDNPYSPAQFASVVTTLSAYWNRQSQYDDLQEFYNLHINDFPSSSRQSLEGSLARIKTNMEWFGTFRDSILTWTTANKI